jgi:hypothetical protein
MKSPRPVRQAALILHWPQATAPAVAREAARRLSVRGIPATWSVDQPSQLEALAGWGLARTGVDAALNVASPAAGQFEESAASRELARRLELLRASGLPVDVVRSGPELLGETWPRALRALGLRGVVIDGRDTSSGARSLPFGVWHFTPQASVPRVRRWTNWFARRRPLLAGAARGPIVATIDLTRVGQPGAREWHEVDAVLDEAAAADREGAAALVTMSELTAHLAQSAAPRPQRSILRAA